MEFLGEMYFSRKQDHRFLFFWEVSENSDFSSVVTVSPRREEAFVFVAFVIRSISSLFIFLIFCGFLIKQ